MTTGKVKDEAPPVDALTLTQLPSEILMQIFGHVAEDRKSWEALMRTSRKVNHIASPFRYWTSNVHNHLKLHIKRYTWPLCADPQSSQGESLIGVLARSNQSLLSHVQVLHMHCATCMQSSLRNQPVHFPNLGVLHTYQLSQREQYHFPGETAPRLHTIVVHSNDALQEWQKWCQRDEPFSVAKRMIIHWWGSPPHTTLFPEPRSQDDCSGATLRSLHVLLQSTAEDKVGCESQAQPLVSLDDLLEPYTVHWELIHGLAEICSSKAQSIVISGTDRISKLIWRCQALAGDHWPEEARFDIVQEKVKVATRQFLSRTGLCKDDINAHMLKVEFTTSAEYMKNWKQRHEVGGQLLEYMTRSH